MKLFNLWTIFLIGLLVSVYVSAQDYTGEEGSDVSDPGVDAGGEEAEAEVTDAVAEETTAPVEEESTEGEIIPETPAEEPLETETPEPDTETSETVDGDKTEHIESEQTGSESTEPSTEATDAGEVTEVEAETTAPVEGEVTTEAVDGASDASEASEASETSEVSESTDGEGTISSEAEETTAAAAEVTSTVVVEDTTTEGSGDTDEPIITTVVPITITPDPSGKCEQNEFFCDSKCIDLNKRCDTIIDCEDQSDEKDCEFKCGEDKFKCNSENVCLDREQVCNGQNDCSDGSDESQCAPTKPLSVILTKGPIVVAYGGSFSIVCRVQGTLPDLSALLYKDQSPIGEQDGLTITYNVSQARSSDAGRYICYGFNADRSQYEVDSVEVEVQSDGGASPTPGPSSDYKIYPLGETIDLVCPVPDDTDQSEIRWIKTNGQLDEYYHRQYQNRLFLYYAKVEDNGEYVCYYRNQVMFRQTLYVGTAPQPTQPPPTPGSTAVEYNPNDTIEIVCQTTAGIVNENIVWRKIDGQLDDYYHRPYGDRLYLYYAKPEDTGVYACYYNNAELSRTSVYVKGSVTRPPTQPPTQPPTKPAQYAIRLAISPSGDEVQSSAIRETRKTCDVATNGNNLKVEWYNNQGRIISDNTGSLRVETVTRSEQPLQIVATLIITNAGPEQAGYYECRATVNAQTESQSFYLRYDTGVIQPACRIDEATCRNYQCVPKSSLCNGIRDCTDGSDEEGCVSGGVSGRCEPNEKKCRNGKCIQKYWFCDGDLDCEDGSDEENCPGSTIAKPPGELCRITEFKCASGNQCVPKGFVCDGEFDCQDNSDESGCIEPRIVRGPVRNITVFLGQTLQIECEAAGFPIPFINWRLNWGHVCEEPRCEAKNENGKGILIIRNAMRTDSGAYSCEAINSKGRVFAIPDAQLTVRYIDERPKCECYNHASVCAPDGTCINCQHNTRGRNCEYCAEGYVGDPRRGTPYDCEVARPQLNCNPAGTQDWSGGYCRCKYHVTGERCDQCKPGGYFLDQSYIKGCRTCFCNGLDVYCRSSDFYYNKLSTRFQDSTEGWKISNLTDILESANLIINPKGTLEFTNPQSFPGQDLYFAAPADFIGNKLASYGGVLRFNISYEGRSVDSEIFNLDVRISGSFIAISHNYTNQFKAFQPYTDHRIEIPLKEEFFHRVTDNSPVSREHFLMALSKIDNLLIRATFVRTQYSAQLKDVELDVARDRPDPLRREQITARAVEVCSCPEGYQGLSCESCAPGYRRDDGGFYWGLCVRDIPCNCNGFASECDSSGRCVNCRNNTWGDSCEYCVDGYVRDGPRGCRIDVNIFIGNDEVELSPAQNHTVYVQIFGNTPVQRVYWYKEGTRGLPSGVYQDGNNLVFVNSYPDIAGTYICEIFTPRGTLKKYLVIKYPLDVVGSKPVITKPEDNQVFYATVGQQLELECVAVGSPSPLVHISTPTYAPASIMDPYRPASATDQRGTNTARYVIERFSNVNVGEYTCTASNSYGTVSHRFRVLLPPTTPPPPSPEGVRPYVLISPENIEAYEGAALIINSTFQGSDPVTVTVERYQPTREPADYFIVDRNTKHIEVRRITKDMEGIYLVSATNPFGTSGAYFRLTVIQRSTSQPQIIFSQTAIRIEAGSELNILPTVRYEGEPRFVWTKDGGQIPAGAQISGQYNLVIPRVNKEHEGQYTLTLTDSVGTVRVPVYVTVITPRPAPGPSPTSRKIVVNRDMNLDVNVGDSINLICDLRRNYQNNVMTTTTWYKGKRVHRLRFPPNIRASHELLQLKNLRLEDSGEYTCGVNANDGTYQTAIVNLRVKESSDEPTVRLAENEKVLNVDEKLELRCIYNGASSASWLFNGSPISSNGYVQINNGYLVIQRVQPQNAGYYSCRATNARGQYAEDRARVTVNVRTREPERLPELYIDVNPKQSNQYVGETAQFTCIVSNADQANVRITWSRSEGRLPANSYEGENGLLVIRNLQEQDSGVYICNAEDISTRVRNSASVSLSVSAQGEPEPTTPLRVEVTPKEATLVQGGEAEFVCRVEGGNRPTVAWTKLNGEIDKDPRFKVDGNVLRISGVREDDRGYFLCTAQSGDLVAREYVRVDVEVRESPRVEIYPTEAPVLRYGDTGYLQCRVVAGTPPPTIEWKRENDRPLTDKVNITHGGALLYITNVGPEEFGTYTCIARNSAGENSASIDIKLENSVPDRQPEIVTQPPPVTQPSPSDDYSVPDIYVPVQNVEVYEGDDAVLTCKTNFRGSVNFDWIKSGSDAIIKSSADGTYTLSAVGVQDSGDYLCRVSNAYGSASAYIRLYVNPRPSTQPESELRVSIAPRERTVPVGGYAEFSCNVQGWSPEDIPEIRWTRADGEISGEVNIAQQPGSSVLRIENIRPENSGRYVCTAQSSRGVAFNAAHLEVSQTDPQSAFPVYVKVVEKPTYSVQTPSGAFKFGIKMTVECETRNPEVVDVSWSRLEGVIRSAVKYDKQSQSNTMNLPALLPMDLGTYICLATARDGSKGQSVVVFERVDQPNQFRYIVHGPKEISPDYSGYTEAPTRYQPTPTAPSYEESQPIAKIAGERSIDIYEGESSNLVCDVQGVPKPEISWERHGGDLPAQHEANGNILRVFNLQESDSGYYICNARNSVGSTRDYVYIRVNRREEGTNSDRPHSEDNREDNREKNTEASTRDPYYQPQDGQYKPVVYLRTSSRGAVISTGQEFTLTCYSSDPNARLTWTKVGGEADLNVNTNQDGGSLNAELTFNPLTAADLGSYRCQAENQYGASEETAILDLNDDEEITFKTDKQGSAISASGLSISISKLGYTSQGGSVRLTCDVQGEANVLYFEWSKYPKLPNNSQKYYNSLTITDFNPIEDSGLYYCSVVTDRGDFRVSKFLGSEDFLVSQNQFIKFQVTSANQISVVARPGTASKSKWIASESVPSDVYTIDADGLKLNQIQDDSATYVFICDVEYDTEFGPTRYEFEITKGIVDRVFQSVPSETTPEASNETTPEDSNDDYVDCKEGEECNNSSRRRRRVRKN